MSFAHPLWLLLGLLGPLILLLHLRRRRMVEVSSTYLWQRIAGASRPQTSWKPPTFNPLLLLQLLVLLFAALALARPLWGETAPRSDHVVYVLDASLSMQATDVAPSRFEAAKRYILEDMARRWSVGEGYASLLTVAPWPEIAGARLKTIEQLRATLERVEGSHGSADWEEAVAHLPGLLVSGESVRIVLASDGNDEAHAALVSALPEAAIEAVSFASETDNFGLVEANLEPLNSEGQWRLWGHVAFFGTETVTVPLSVYFAPEGGQGALEWASIALELEARESSPFSLELTLPGPGVVELSLPEDSLAYDNHAFFVVRAALRTVRVLHVGPDNAPLQQALEAVGELELFRAAMLPEASAGYDLVIVDRVAVSRHPGTNTLWLGADPTMTAEGSSRLADPYPSGWRSGHPLGHSVDWTALSIVQARALPRLAGAEVLLEAAGSPLIQARTGGYGREVVVAFALHESTWAEQPSFPAFIANLLHWIEPSLGRALTPPCRVGEPCQLDPRSLAGEWRLMNPQGADVPLPEVFVAEAGVLDERARMWLPDGFETMFRPRQAGLYLLEAGNARYPIAVNAFAAQESDIHGTGSTPPTAVRPLWPWLLALALVALLAEGWLAGWRIERIFRPAALASANPLAGRRRLVLVLHGLAALLFLLALLQVPLRYPLRESYAVFVVDRPEVHVGGAKTRLEGFLERAAREASASKRGGLVWLGPYGQLGIDLGSRLDSWAPGAETAVATNLASALSLAAGMLPEPGRIVVVADGAETRGDLATVLSRFAARGLPVDVYPLGGVPAGEVFVEEVFASQRLHESDPFLLQGIVYSERQTSAVVRVWREGELWAEQEVNLLPGRNRIEMVMIEEAAGSYLYELEVAAEGDGFIQNNREGMIVEIRSTAKVAIFTPQASWGETLAEALRVQGLAADVLAPNRAPYYLGHDSPTITGWLDYDVVILMNVPTIDLHSVQQEHLETWVREYGGGLIVLGGENTFGPGGYYQTVLEDMLPLSTKIPHEKPSVAISFVLDRSGSMQQRVGEVTRLDVAKRATLSAVELLDEESLVGVVVFDSDAAVLVPMQRAGDYEGLQAKLEPLQAGGGTSIYPGLVLGYEQLLQVDAELTRHIVVMTDGLSQPGDFEGILEEITAAGITVSTAAIGQGADVRLLETIARRGGGAAHVTTDFQAFPSILAQEALLLSDEPLRDETFAPLWEDRTAPFEGLPDNLPPLHGYVQTTAKPGARIHLYGPEDTPLLASWRYGLGQVVAFASHGVGPWAADWLALSEYPLIWAQAIRWALPATPRPGLNLQLARRGDTIDITVEAVESSGDLQVGLALEAEVIMPTGEHILELRETEPGRYEGWLIAEQAGSYHVRVRALDEAPNDIEGSIHLGYPARYAFDPQGAERLTALAHATGGRVLLGDEPIFVGSAPLRWVSRPGWPLWALFGLALFMAGLLLRYGSAMTLLGSRLSLWKTSRPRMKGLSSFCLISRWYRW